MLHEMKILAQKMRPHFKNDPRGLEVWIEHEQEVLGAFEHRLLPSLASPTNLPVSLSHFALS